MPMSTIISFVLILLQIHL